MRLINSLLIGPEKLNSLAFWFDILTFIIFSQFGAECVLKKLISIEFSRGFLHNTLQKRTVLVRNVNANSDPNPARL